MLGHNTRKSEMLRAEANMLHYETLRKNVAEISKFSNKCSKFATVIQESDSKLICSHYVVLPLQ